MKSSDFWFPEIVGTISLIAAIVTLCLSLIFSAPAQAAGREELAAKSAEPRLEKKFTGLKIKKGDPVFIRIFKQEAVLELWMKPEGSDRFVLFHAYPICAWSGGLGPKTRQGDRQAPEGFYAVGLKHLNPFSNYHLSFNLGYPNSYEKLKGYTGSYLMVHGNCLSDGCYAMTDAGIEEIYTLVKAALDKGQPFFRVHCFPFRFTKKNLESFKSHKWLNFWQMLEPAYSYFENKHIPPDIIVENGSYKISD